MIRILRRPLQSPLREACDERHARLQALLDSGAVPPASLLDAYRDPPLKAHLVDEARGKCMYCEAKTTHVYYGDVEHIRPKSKFPRDRLNIDNLGFACARCNGAKLEFWDPHSPLVNPYAEEPADFVLPFGYMILRRPGNDRGRVTVSRLDLNRQALLERRRERIQALENLGDQYVNAPPGPIKDLLRAELTQQAGDDSEFALVVRAYLATACGLNV